MRCKDVGEQLSNVLQKLLSIRWYFRSRRPNVALTGLLLGAGASYETGMPLASELTKELKNWLTPAKLRSLNQVWQGQGAGYSDTTINDLAIVLSMDSMTYEHIIGYLEVQSERVRERSQEYDGLLAFMSEIIYFILEQKHVLNVSFVSRNIQYLDGIKALVKANKPLWVFSLNHDLIMECFIADACIPVRYGFSNEIVRLPRRDMRGAQTGELEAHVTRRDQFAKHTLSFFQPGVEGINLLKVHGSLDEFAFNDGHDLLKLVPNDNSASGVISVLRSANDEVRYIDPRWPGGVVSARNEIAYADADGEMQFLRRTPLAGAFKFQGRSRQTVPNELLSYFTVSLNYLSTLICIGYGFGDQHVNGTIRNWLEGDGSRQLMIVDPGVERVPTLLLHLTPQVELVNLEATDYLDRAGGISRTRMEGIERQFAALMRDKNRNEAGSMIKQYMDQLADGVAERMVDWVKTLPWRDGSIDLEKMGLTMEEFLKMAQAKIPMPSPDDALEDFLRQATDPS